MSKQLYSKFELAEARGHIPQGMAPGLTYATILESGVRAVAEGYYGPQAVNQAERSAAKDEQHALDLADDVLADVKSIIKVYSGVDDFLAQHSGGRMAASTHTTSDFPKALASLRQTIIRQDTPIGQPAWRSWVPGRLIGSTPDFKAIRGLNMTEMGELKLRPEGTDVTFTSMGFSSDHFYVANYERAFGYTWEMWKNDELAAFVRGLRTLGEAALRTEAIVIFTAILNGVSRTTGTGISTGGPTSTVLAALRKVMAARTVTDADRVSTIGRIYPNHLVYGSEWADTAAIALDTRYTDHNNGTPNVVFQAFEPHMERLWARVFTSDWIVFDDTIDFIDVRFLEGFEGGPLTYSKMPDVSEHPDQGSFDNHSLQVKVGHTLGAKITNAKGVGRVQGA